MGAAISDNEPESSVGASAQVIDYPGDSVAARALGSDRQNGVLSPAPALENTPPGAPADGGGSNGQGDHLGAVAQPAPDRVDAIPLPACREGAEVSHNEPEDSVNVSLQAVDSQGDSVDARLSGSDRQNGVLSPAPALENAPPEASPQGGGSEGQATTRAARLNPCPIGPRRYRCRLAGGPTASWPSTPSKRRTVRHRPVILQETPVDRRLPGSGRPDGVFAPGPGVPIRPGEVAVHPAS